MPKRRCRLHLGIIGMMAEAGSSGMRPSESNQVSLPYRAAGRLPSIRGLMQHLFRRALHAVCYHLLLKRRGTTEAYAAGFRFVLPPTVFHPKYFASGEVLAEV